MIAERVARLEQAFRVACVLLVSCNLGGAASPIGDFPAILLLGQGSMTFSAYLACAGPPTLVALALLLVLVRTFIRPARDLDADPLTRRHTQPAGSLTFPHNASTS